MVCVYQYSEDKEDWELVGNFLMGSAPGDEMGKSISLDDSDSMLAVGTRLSNKESGHVDIYSYN